jgi:hypothetical protein
LPVVIAGCAPPTLASVYAGAAGKKAWNVEHRVGDAHALPSRARIRLKRWHGMRANKSN